MKFRFLLCLLSILMFSCTETKTNTPTEKDLFFLKSDKNNPAEIDSITKKIVDYEFKIEKVDSLITYLKPENYSKSIYERFQKKYKFDDTFEGKFISLDSGATLTKSATMTHRRFSFFDEYSRDTYVVKKFTKTYQNLNFEGYSGIKHIFQIFNTNDYTKSTEPLYKVQAYGDHIRLYEEEGYFVCSRYGCCLSTNTYELFDLKGNYILASNNTIKSIITNNKTYYVGIIQSEYTNIPVLFIKDSSGTIQYIQFSGTPFDTLYHFEYYIKLKNQKSPYIPKLASTFSEYKLNNLDDLELWLPFNEKDTLKIPFKNEKAFGVDYPQLKVLLTKNN